MDIRSIQLACGLILLQAASLAVAQQAEEESIVAQRAAGAVELGLQHAAAYDIYRDEQRDAKLKLHPSALFKFTNPTPQESSGQAQELYGAVFVLTDQGRPAVVFSILNIYSPGVPFVVHELSSLSEHRVLAERDGQQEWHPDRPGAELVPVAGAPAPATTAAGRMTQMRLIARQYSANKTDANGRTTQLRLLSRPLYRYASSEATTIDGAMFAFVDGTDPEVLLMLEAREGEIDGGWHFAAARLNNIQDRLFHLEQPVWEAPHLTTAQWKRRDRPYALIRQPPTVSPP